MSQIQQEAAKNGSPAVVSALEDGRISRTELNSAIQAMYACWKSKDVYFEDTGTNPVDGWRPTYGVDQSDPAKVEGCSRENYDYVEAAWRLQKEDRMDPELMQVIRTCLTQRGEATTGNEKSAADLVPGGTSDQARLDRVVACGEKGAQKFPNQMWSF